MATGRFKRPFPYGSTGKMPTNTLECGSVSAAVWLIVMLIQERLYSPRFWGIHYASGAPRPPQVVTRWAAPLRYIYTLLILIIFCILDAKYRRGRTTEIRSDGSDDNGPWVPGAPRGPAASPLCSPDLGFESIKSCRWSPWQR